MKFLFDLSFDLVSLVTVVIIDETGKSFSKIVVISIFYVKKSGIPQLQMMADDALG
ncbi:MAG TPA: hypothetical protein VNW29_04675 [Candidatus Sulfotelmatobacter sp.]|nr:hypothetical protein [Candidatus Sulfotelmatobacter sp.]